MRGATDITKLEFEYNNQPMKAISTWVSDLNHVYIKFQRADNTTLQVRADEVTNYIKQC